MEDITRIEVNRIIELLRENTATSNVHEKNKLAEALEKAEIIPNLMISAYVKAVNRAIKTIKIKQDDQLDGETITGLDNELKLLNLDHINFSKSKLEAVKVLFEYAEERKNLICEFDDSKHPRTKTGRCQYENHYDDLDVGSFLTEDEMKKFDILNDTKGWYSACKEFEDKLNPDNQEITITLNIDDDQHKYDDTDAEYVCKTCMEEIADNGCGYASCDLE